MQSRDSLVKSKLTEFVLTTQANSCVPFTCEYFLRTNTLSKREFVDFLWFCTAVPFRHNYTKDRSGKLLDNRQTVPNVNRAVETRSFCHTGYPATFVSLIS